MYFFHQHEAQGLLYRNTFQITFPRLILSVTWAWLAYKHISALADFQNIIGLLLYSLPHSKYYSNSFSQYVHVLSTYCVPGTRISGLMEQTFYERPIK